MDNNFFSDFILKLNSIHNNSEFSNNSKFIEFNLLITELFENLIKEFELNYTSFYSLSFFIINKYKLSSYEEKIIKEIYFLNKKINTNSNFQISLSQLNFYFNCIYLIVCNIFKVKLPPTINKYFERNNINKIENINLKYNFINVKVAQNLKVDKGRQITCFDEDLGNFNLILNNKWKEQANIIFENIELNLLNVEILIVNNTINVVCGNDSFLVINPNYLFDVTDCSKNPNKKNYFFYFISKFINKNTSRSLLIGNIVNNIFDELINLEEELKDEATFDGLFEDSIKKRILSFLVIYNSNDFNYKELRNEILYYYDNLIKIISKLEKGDYSTEPSFIAPKYGIQGRLDLLIENEEENFTSILELKTGKSPKEKISFFVNNILFISNLWIEHYFQVTGYNLLLNNAYDLNKINNCIIYSKEITDPIRIATIDQNAKNQFLFNRNYLASLDYKLYSGSTKIIQEILISENIDISKFNNYNIIDYKHFIRVYLSNTELVKTWFNQMIVFISKEIYISKVGSEYNKGFSSVWLDDIEKKEKDKTILTNQKFCLKDSSFEVMHLAFTNDSSENKSIFRLGDLVLIYPNLPDANNPTNHILYKGYIKEVTNNKIYVSLRNKSINTKKFLLFDLWNIELDVSDSNNRNQFLSIFQFLEIEQDKKELILGIKEQDYSEESYKSSLDLKKSQKEVFNKSLQAKSYFLIQGPPGTGKTSYELAALIDYYYNQTEKIILVSAYTNRAVEEIYQGLLKVISQDEMIKIGIKTGHKSDEILISTLLERNRITELNNKIKKCRVFLSTTSSLFTNREIFDLKKFDIAIIDEASQILESQIIGILSKVDKFILIGDENQLPAVTLSTDNTTMEENSILKEIELNDYNTSYFERMLTILKKNNWTKSFGMLKEQARMHAEIMEFPNIRIYNNHLVTLNKSQHKISQKFKKNNKNKLEDFLVNYRISFIDCPIEKENKISIVETQLVLEIVDLINKSKKIENNSEVGIISPFKLQCNNIYMEMEEELRNLVTVDTVERYQGSQRNIIIISMAVNSNELLQRAISESSYSKIDRKLNVAVTRAKEHVIILGNEEILNNSSDYKHIIEFCKSKKSFITYKELKETV